ncbi:carnitine/acyl carnitine carrier [Pholiota conissans]|uniref:Carnitine/acyl carnitine carrier n=1 Tax=Pholiota conissans TaxID=109636 RepID=A0A9P6D4D5_9AGAR|nr:carnitine/acyl carnitine carrier [Pholiota conissans]
MATDGPTGTLLRDISPRFTGDVALNPTIDFIAGTIAGMSSLVVGFPFDTVKVRFQSPAIASKYHSTFNAIATIVREERFIGLYKGITSPLATVALMNGLVFASYRFLLKLQLPDAACVPTLAQIALAGAGCGIVSSIVTTPTELIKIRQQALLTPTTARQVAWQIFRENGVRGLYRGLPVTALRDCGYGAYFAAYEATCRYFSSPPPSAGTNILAEVESQLTQLSWPALLLAGGIAGIAGWVVTFPLDVVKTRVQGSQPMLVPVSESTGPRGGVSPSSGSSSSPGGVSGRGGLHKTRLHEGTPLIKGMGHPLPGGNENGKVAAKTKMRDVNPYRSTWSTIVHSYRNEGMAVFWRGLSPTLIRAIPVNMVTFAMFEAVVHTLS